MTTQTKAEIHQENQESGIYLPQREQIMEVVSNNPGLTRSEISRESGLTINAVTGRIHELISAGQLQEGGTKFCSISGKRVGTIWLKAPTKWEVREFRGEKYLYSPVGS